MVQRSGWQYTCRPSVCRIVELSLELRGLALRKLIACSNSTKSNETDINQAADACLKHGGIVANDKVGARGEGEADK